MSIVRMIIGSVLLLCTLGLGFVSYLLLFEVANPHHLVLPGYGEIATGYIVLGLCILFLLVTIMVLPIGSLLQGKDKSDMDNPDMDMPDMMPKKRRASNAVRKPSADAGKTPNAGARKSHQDRESGNLVMEASQSTADPEVVDSSTYSRLEDPLAMAKLVALDQSDLTIDALREICDKYYPDGLIMADRIMPDCEYTAEAVARHVISVARNKLKMTDPNLSDRQFTIFQERVFGAEREPITRTYLPETDISALPEDHREYVGKIFDKRDWEKAQRHLRADRSDWKEVSFASAAEVLKI